jgi:hypothetical protein
VYGEFLHLLLCGVFDFLADLLDVLPDTPEGVAAGSRTAAEASDSASRVLIFFMEVSPGAGG